MLFLNALKASYAYSKNKLANLVLYYTKAIKKVVT
jgi:hypothetical protein